jgi:hypothetical protein
MTRTPQPGHRVAQYLSLLLKRVARCSSRIMVTKLGDR